MGKSSRHNPRERKRVKVSRNAPCLCGSGLKWKNCCHKKEVNAQNLRVNMSRKVRALMEAIHKDYFSSNESYGKVLFGEFIVRVKVENPEPDVYIYEYHSPFKDEGRIELAMVSFEETKLIARELLRNNTTYEQIKNLKAEDTSEREQEK